MAMHGRYGQPKLWTRDNATGLWNIQSASQGGHLQPLASTQQADAVVTSTTDTGRESPSRGEVPEQAGSTEQACGPEGTAEGGCEKSDREAALDKQMQQSLVLVTVEIPHVGLLDGVHAKSFTGKLSTTCRGVCWEPCVMGGTWHGVSNLHTVLHSENIAVHNVVHYG